MNSPIQVSIQKFPSAQQVKVSASDHRAMSTKKPNTKTPVEETPQTAALTVIPIEIDPALPESRKEVILGGYTPIYKQIQELDLEVSALLNADVTVFTLKTAKKARELRLKCVALRGKDGLKGVHDSLKEDVKLEGQVIDLLERKPRETLMGWEEKLKEIEEFQEREEARRVAELHDSRTEAISMYILDPNAPELAVLGDMTDERWETVFENFRTAWNTEQERLAKEKLRKERLDIAKTYELYIEEFSEIAWESLTEKMFNSIVSTAKDMHERREKAAEVERQKAEEIRLKAEQAAKEAEERAKRYRTRVALVKGAEQREDGLYYSDKKIATVKSLEDGTEDAFQTFLTGHLAKYEADVAAEAARKEAEQKALEERAAVRARMQADIDAQVAAEAKARKEAAEREAEMNRKRLDAEAAAQVAMGAPDSEKLRELAKAFSAVEVPTCSSEKGIALVSKFKEMQEKWIAGLERVAAEMEGVTEEVF